MIGYDIYLNRYLIVLRVTSSLAWFPVFPSAELSLILGKAIAERLPTIQARPWIKSLAQWDACLKPFGGKISSISKTRSRSRRKKKKLKLPEASWPIESVLFFYPGKRNYGRGELILWELKLFGKSADHGLFLEVILPALEELGSIPDSRWQYPNCLWGKFDIQSVYMARGPRWEPVVKDGRLDLSYKAGPLQWSEGLTFEPAPHRASKKKSLKSLTWLTPFQFGTPPSDVRIPTLRWITEAFIERVALLMQGKYYNIGKFLDILNQEDQSALWNIIEADSHIPVFSNDIQPAPGYCPGRWTGAQTFTASIPDSLIPYLGLASIFHIGKYSHFGCGTFFIR
ncbi:hypothetical protein QUF80_23535 [Desulfococcaceae bacterium HSG8]|nr:hypothetical protein [Desulfococcaceae bacterium HSG8]